MKPRICRSCKKVLLDMDRMVYAAGLVSNVCEPCWDKHTRQLELDHVAPTPKRGFIKT